MRDGYILGIIPETWRLELTKFPLVRRLLRSRWMPLSLILFNVFLFTVILMAGLMGGLTSAGNYNFGIMIVWILWWVALMTVLVPGLSRFWCTMCPLPFFGEWLQRLRLFSVRHERGRNLYFGLNKRWPRSLSNMWLMNILFLVTTFFSSFITVRPAATFVLLASIIVLSITLSLIYRARTFCLYVCPVSGFQGLYSNFALTEVRVKDPEICARHKQKGCVVGNERGYGCPWLLLPYAFKRNTYCGMCFECLKTCEYDNMAVNLRPPGVDLLVDEKRGLDEAYKALIMLGIAIVFFVTFQGPWGVLKDWANAKTISGYLTFIGLHASWNLAILPGIFLIFAWAARRASREDLPIKKVFVNFSYATVPLGLAAWVAFSWGIILPNGSYLLHVLSDPFAWGWDLFGTAGFPWTPVLTGLMPYLMIAAMLAGLLFSMDVAIKIAKQTFSDRENALMGALPILIFLVLMTGGLMWLFVA
jgi:hypothetical protein